jgi:hypothetical protein
MQFVLEEPATPTAVAVKDPKKGVRAKHHYTDDSSPAYVTFLCGRGASAEELVAVPETGTDLCQKCRASSDGDARVKRLFR